MATKNLRESANLISFRQLKLFDSIARMNSVRKASEECNLSQPAVTQALATLEQRIGTMLVDRRASGSYLNEAGQIFQRRTARFFEQTEQALVELGVPGGAAGAKLVVKRLSRSQIRSLIAVVEHNSFANAAEALEVSHASLQRAIRDLEANLHKPLSYRSAAGLMIAPHGSEFGRRMHLALQEIEWGIREVEAAKGSFAAEMVIGAMPSGGSVLLASALDDFVCDYPQAELRILNETSPVVLKSLRNGWVDLVVGLLPEGRREDLTYEPFAETPYLIVAHPRHPLLRKGKVTLEDLFGYEWVVGTPGSSRRACFDRLFAGRPGPRARIATCALPIVRSLLAGSDRLTLMTSYELNHEESGLAEVSFGPIDLVPTMGITMRTGWLPTKMHIDFIETLRRRMTLRAKAGDRDISSAA